MHAHREHITGILKCSAVAAFIGWGALLLFDYGFWYAPASISRRMIEHSFHAIHSIAILYLAPIPGWRSFSAGQLWLAGIPAALVWGSAIYALLHLLRVTMRRIHRHHLAA